MNTWIQTFNATQQTLEEQLAAKAEAQRQAREAKRAARHAIRFTPMEQRIERILAGLSPEERAIPRHIEFFQTALQAKYPARGAGRASLGEIGQGLRRLGWRRERCWRKQESGFRSIWYPPITDQ